MLLITSLKRINTIVSNTKRMKLKKIFLIVDVWNTIVHKIVVFHMELIILFKILTASFVMWVTKVYIRNLRLEFCMAKRKIWWKTFYSNDSEETFLYPCVCFQFNPMLIDLKSLENMILLNKWSMSISGRNSPNSTDECMVLL